MPSKNDPTPFEVDYGDGGTTVGPEIVLAVIGVVVLLIGLVARSWLAIALGLAGVVGGAVLVRR